MKNITRLNKRISLFLICHVLFLFAQAEKIENMDSLTSGKARISVRFNHYDYSLFNKLIKQKEVEVKTKTSTHFLESQWDIELKSNSVKEDPNAMDVEVVFYCKEGTAPETALSVDLEFDNWSTNNYVLMPGAAYNGNRFPSRRINYSPKLLDPRDIGPDKGIILSDIPKLNEGNGPSFIQQRSGDMTTPSIGFYSQGQQQGFFLLTEQANQYGDYGISIEENRTRSRASISISSPVVRELYKYRIADSRFASDDKAADFSQGDRVTIKFRIYSFPANEIQDLFSCFSEIRKDLPMDREPANVLPYSSAFEVQEDKFNDLNFVPEWGYYSVGMRENMFQDWQIGWTGGMISTYPLLFEGSDSTRQNVIRNFDWLFPNGISPSGFFWCSGEKGNIWHGGDPRKPHTKNWHLIRKSGDGLYYVIKQFLLMEKMGIPVKESWKEGAKTVANAFVNLWNTNHQLGQFVDNVTGEIQVGGSTSGGITPAALSLASNYFNNPEYLTAAREIGGYFHENYIKKGLTCGGPGDALQNFDSESCYALVESYAVLYETTGEKKWLEIGEEIARQFSTWVISYNYEFPENSLYAKKGIHSIGAVNANTQNKHGSPGICTHSGSGLLKLYRATGDKFYIDLLYDIAHNIPQYLVHPLRPIEGVPNGFMTERVNTTDWLEGIGEIMYGSTWAETSLMLTYIEIPGLYVQPDRSFFKAFDNIEVDKVNDTESRLVLKVTNPTETTAKVKILSENESDIKLPLGHNYLLNAHGIHLEPGESKVLTFRKR
ncbi:MAG: hypothetical protein JEZ14_07885 [Marinilabiliaceae bacterium]|nr:hypothetical protein [Marinilabiliaceae bacterium]